MSHDAKDVALYTFAAKCVRCAVTELASPPVGEALGQCISALELLQWKAVASGAAELGSQLVHVLRALLAARRSAQSAEASVPAADGDSDDDVLGDTVTAVDAAASRVADR